MIDPAITLQIRMDYYASDDQNTLQITVEEADLFWAWFGNEATRLQVLDYDDHEIQNDYHVGQCFNNAQTETLENGIPYYEGFTLINQHHYLHAFNSMDGQVLDVTALNQPDLFRDINGLMPAIYYGITIPADFIAAQNPNNGCLLRSYFIASIAH